MSERLAPPGWYPDRLNAAQLRWWDGRQWTEHTSPMGKAQPTPSVPRPPHSPPPSGGTSARFGKAAKAAGRWVQKHPKVTFVGLVAFGVFLLGAIPNHDDTPRRQTASDPTTSVKSSAKPKAHGGTTKIKHAHHAGPPGITSAPVDRAQGHGSRLAVVVLKTLPIKGRAPMTNYSREQFGPDWTDENNDVLGHNGCDTRNDILRRDLSAKRLAGCEVVTGILRDPYTSRTIHFRRGEATSLAVQIDHVVSLGDAWQTGAQRWASSTRIDLGNDPLNLLAVDGPTNESKGDGDAATWLPPNKAYRCAYVARQIAVKARYRLWVTQPEHDAMARVLTVCPRQRVPHEAGQASVVMRTPTKPAQLTGPTSVYYPNCTAAKAAGAAPLYRGQPGYRSDLDADGDGVACES